MKVLLFIFLAVLSGVATACGGECDAHGDCSSGHVCVNGSCELQEADPPDTDTEPDGPVVVPPPPTGGDGDVDTDTDTNNTDTGGHDTDQYANCYEGNFTITDLLALDDFYPYDCILGNLAIATYGQGLVEVNLPNLEYVGGNLDIDGNSDLYSLSNLLSLQRVEGTLQIWANNLLLDVDGLGNLAHVGGSLLLEGNPALDDLSGLLSLETVGGTVRFENNIVLSSLDGMENLVAIGRNLEISSQPYLADISGLQDLSTIGGDLSIYQNQTLPDCDVCDLVSQLSFGPTNVVAHSNQSDNCTSDPLDCTLK